MAPMNRSARAEHWQRIVDRFHSSGLSVAQFSKKYRISAQSLYQWRRKLLPQTETAATASKMDGKFLPVRIVRAVAMDQTLSAASATFTYSFSLAFILLSLSGTPEMNGTKFSKLYNRVIAITG
jgi:transposase-like protein